MLSANYLIVYALLAVVLVYLSWRSLLSGTDYLRMFREAVAPAQVDPAEHVSVILPCKGLDTEIEHNINAVLTQDHPSYEVIFVVSDESDEVVSVIERATSFSSTPSKVVVAAVAKSSSQKVENLREGILHARENSLIFVFVDSDARPGSDWLRALVEPLQDPLVGASTGFRWLISREGNLASELRSVWNASVASRLERDAAFCWGGSTAVRRATFERLNIREQWRGTLSDDFTLSRILKGDGLAIRFVPKSLTPSFGDCSFRGLFEFTTRQMKITRVYSPELWMATIFGSGLYCIVLIASLPVLFSSDSRFQAVAVVTIVLVTIFSVAKAWLRLRAVGLVLEPYENELKRQWLPHLTLWIITPFIFLYNSLAALVSRTLTWRGIRYRLVSPVETQVIGRFDGRSG